MLVPVILFSLATFASGKVCENNQFWSSILERCENCSRCTIPNIVIRPCEGFADTFCGPLSDLNIDWTWLKSRGSHHSSGGGGGKHGSGQKEMLDTFNENFDQIRQHEMHVREKQKQLLKQHRRLSHRTSDEVDDVDDGADGSDEIESGDIFVGDRYHRNHKKKLWDRVKAASGKHRTLDEKVSDDLGRNRNRLEPDVLKTLQKLMGNRDRMHFNDVKAMELLKSSRKPADKRENDTAYDPNHLKFDENGILIKNFGFTKVEDNVKIEKLIDDSNYSEDLSMTERFILDWQTIILGIAVSSCIIFFFVAAIYSIQHAKHWKKLRNYFDADVEELRSWISSNQSESKIPPSGIYKTTTEVVHTGGTQCKYLERIIRMNGKNRFNFVTGNVYEKDNKRPQELKPLTKKYPTVHKTKHGDRL